MSKNDCDKSKFDFENSAEKQESAVVVSSDKDNTALQHNTYDDRMVPTLSNEEIKNSYVTWKLSKNAWKVYFWLIAHANWNSKSKEKHYYLYKKDFKQIDVAHDCSIKEERVSVAVKELKEHGILTQHDKISNAVIISWPYNRSIGIDKDIILLMIAFSDVINLEYAVRMFAVLKKIWEIDRTHPFSLNGLCYIFGKKGYQKDRVEILSFLIIFKSFGLIDYRKEKYYGEDSKVYTRYYLTNVANFLDDDIKNELFAIDHGERVEWYVGIQTAVMANIIEDKNTKMEIK